MHKPHRYAHEQESLKALRELLHKHVKENVPSDQQLESLIERLANAADRYIVHRGASRVRLADGSEKTIGIGEIREQLAKLERELRACIITLNDFSHRYPDALGYFCDAYDAPIGTLKHAITKGVSAAQTAANNAEAAPHKQPDNALVLLTYDVGVELQKINCALAISVPSEGSFVTGKRGGALWARTTLEVMRIAGIQRPVIDAKTLRAAKQLIDEMPDD